MIAQHVLECATSPCPLSAQIKKKGKEKTHRNVGMLYDRPSINTMWMLYGKYFICVDSSLAFFYRKSPGDKTLKLVCGSCCLPHPSKEATGGEDALFICVDEQAIGVADGVGGWALHGVDAGEYARELMANAVSAIKEEPKGFIDPARVLEKAHAMTKKAGSSTACIIALTDQVCFLYLSQCLFYFNRPNL